MTEKYRMMIYIALATIHIYRLSINNRELLFKRVADEIFGLFNYELSMNQLEKAYAVYLSDGQAIENTEVYKLNRGGY